MANRKNIMRVRLNDAEFVAMENRRGPLSRGGYFRELLERDIAEYTPPRQEELAKIPSYEECLQILFRMAKDGSVQAAIHLVRVLPEYEREQEREGGSTDLIDFLAEGARRRAGSLRSYDQQSTR